MNRHPAISTRVSQNLTRTRAAVSEEKIRSWFAEVLRFLQEEQLTNILNDPNRVFNCDESALFLSPKENAVLAKKGSKAVYSVVANDEKECLTTLITGNASGTIVPSMVVYQYKRVPSIIAESMPPGWAIGLSESGWMTGETFFEFIANVFYPWLLKNNIELPVILFLDGHASHLTLHLSKFCKENKIILIALIANSTHILQPLDVSVFHPLKVEWKKAIRDWRMEHNGNKMKKEHFAGILNKVLSDQRHKTNLVSGFRTCGLCPFDPNAINYKKYFGSEQSDAPETTEDTGSASPANYVNFIEQNISPEKLRIFKATSGQWNGAIEDKNLFLFWKKTCTENTLENEETPNIGDTTLQNNMDVLIETDFQRLLDESEIIFDNSIINEQTQINSSTDKISIDPFCSLINEQTPIKSSTDIITTERQSPIPAYPKNGQPLIPTPFKKNLFWPEVNTTVKTPKLKTPAVAVSDQWIKFQEKKLAMKVNKENLKLANKQKRLEKQKLNSTLKAAKREKEISIQPNNYVIFKYGNIYFPGLVLQLKGTKVSIKSMEASTCGKNWVWPQKDDILWYKKTDIVQVIKDPILTSTSGLFDVPEIKPYYFELN